jgi:hypothetical protein
MIETVLHGLNESSDLRLVTWLRHPVSEGCTTDPKTQGSLSHRSSVRSKKCEMWRF